MLPRWQASCKQMCLNRKIYFFYYITSFIHSHSKQLAAVQVTSRSLPQAHTAFFHKGRQNQQFLVVALTFNLCNAIDLFHFFIWKQPHLNVKKFTFIWRNSFEFWDTCLQIPCRCFDSKPFILFKTKEQEYFGRNMSIDYSWV